MPPGEPVPGQVIRYSYLWAREHEAGREEGVKDRPCVIVLTVSTARGVQIVLVVPITHSPPDDPQHAIELPQPVKQRLGLDDRRSWVVLDEANRFVWPGPDLRPVPGGEPNSFVLGQLPFALFERIRLRLIASIRAHAAASIARSE